MKIHHIKSILSFVAIGTMASTTSYAFSVAKYVEVNPNQYSDNVMEDGRYTVAIRSKTNNRWLQVQSNPDADLKFDMNESRPEELPDRARWIMVTNGSYAYFQSASNLRLISTGSGGGNLNLNRGSDVNDSHYFKIRVADRDGGSYHIASLKSGGYWYRNSDNKVITDLATFDDGNQEFYIKIVGDVSSPPEPPPPPGGGNPHTTVHATADMYFSNQSGHNNQHLRIDPSPNRNRQAYIRFSVPSIPEGIASARLELTCSDDDGNTNLGIYFAGYGTWHEDIDWGERPDTHQLVDSANKFYGRGTTHNFDVTGHVRENSNVTFCVKAIGGSDMAVWSSEGHSTLNPKLVIEKGNGNNNPPPTTPPPSGNDRKIEAEDYNAQSGVQTQASSEGGRNVGWIEDGDWIKFNNINFDNNYTQVDTRVASPRGIGRIVFRLGSRNGTWIGTVDVSNTGGWQSWQTQSTTLQNVSGTHDLFLTFEGGSGYLLNLNHFTLRSSGGGGQPPSEPPTSPPTGNTFVASDDVFFQGSGKQASQQFIRIEHSNRVGYFRFQIPDISGNISRVTLRLTCDGDTGSGRIRVYNGGYSNWNENNINYGNRPGKSGQLDSKNTNYNIGQSYDFDVTEAARFDNTSVTLIVEIDSGSNDCAFAAREHSNANWRPKLIYETGNGNNR